MGSCKKQGLNYQPYFKTSGGLSGRRKLFFWANLQGFQNLEGFI
jgi:hypothetical protein